MKVKKFVQGNAMLWKVNATNWSIPICFYEVNIPETIYAIPPLISFIHNQPFFLHAFSLSFTRNREFFRCEQTFTSHRRAQWRSPLNYKVHRSMSCGCISNLFGNTQMHASSNSFASLFLVFIFIRTLLPYSAHVNGLCMPVCAWYAFGGRQNIYMRVDENERRERHAERKGTIEPTRCMEGIIQENYEDIVDLRSHTRSTDPPSNINLYNIAYII